MITDFFWQTIVRRYLKYLMPRFPLDDDEEEEFEETRWDKECQLDDITIHYQEIGEGRPLVVLHGSRPFYREHWWLEEHIFEQNSRWKRIYPDLPGWGKMPFPESISSQNDILDVILCFLDKVAEGQNVSLVGHTEGTYLAQGVAYIKPTILDGLFLFSPVEIDVQSHEFKLGQELAHKYREMGSVFEIPCRLGTNQALSFDVRELPVPFDRPALVVERSREPCMPYRHVRGILRNYPSAKHVVLGKPKPYELSRWRQQLDDATNEWLERVEAFDVTGQT